MHHHHLKGRFLKPRFLGPNLRHSDLVGLEWAVKTCISSKVQIMLMDQGPNFENHGLEKSTLDSAMNRDGYIFVWRNLNVVITSLYTSSRSFSHSSMFIFPFLKKEERGRQTRKIQRKKMDNSLNSLLHSQKPRRKIWLTSEKTRVVRKRNAIAPWSNINLHATQGSNLRELAQGCPY